MIIDLVLFFTILAIIFPIGLFDSLDPMTFLILLYILQKPNAHKNTLYFLVAFYISYLLMGILIYFIGDQVMLWVDFIYSSSFKYILFVLSGVFIILGVYYLFFKKMIPAPYLLSEPAIDSSRNLLSVKNPRLESKLSRISGWGYALFAFFYNLTYLPFAYPLLFVNLELIKYELDITVILSLLSIYSVAFVLPYFILRFYFHKNQSNFFLKFPRFYQLINSPKITGVMFILLGIILVI